MLIRLSCLYIFLFLLINTTNAQNKGILPLTGIRYFNEGISLKNVEVIVDGSILLNNRLQVNKEFEIRLQSPTGFSEDKSKMIFAAAELNIMSLKGVVLFKTTNVFKDKEAMGFSASAIKEVIIKVQIKPEQIKTDAGCLINIRYYDLKSKNQFRLEFPVTIVKPGERLLISKSVLNQKNVAYHSQTIGVKLKTIQVTVDTSIRVSPKMAYTSLDISGIEGSSISEVLTGKESFWVYDTDLNEIKITDKQLKQVGGSMENNMVNYLSKIPYRLKTMTGKLFFVRFRWESSDMRKIIDVVVMK